MLLVRLVVLLAFVAPSVGAQSNYAVVTGVVKDPQRLPISGATVSFKALATEEVRRVISNEQGLFEADALLPGEYEIRTEATGLPRPCTRCG